MQNQKKKAIQRARSHRDAGLFSNQLVSSPVKRVGHSLTKLQTEYVGLNRRFLLEAAKGYPEEYERTAKRLNLETRAKEDTLVKQRLKIKLDTMFSSKNLNQLISSPAKKRLPRMDSFILNDINPSKTDELAAINQLLANKQAVGQKRLKSFMENMESQNPWEAARDLPTASEKEFLAPALVGLRRSSTVSRSPSPSSAGMKSRGTALPQSPTKKATIVEYHLFNLPLYADNIKNLDFSSQDKQRLIKRREIVRSLKFLRKMGEKLREEQEQMVKELHGQDLKSARVVKRAQSKRAFLRKNNTLIPEHDQEPLNNLAGKLKLQTQYTEPSQVIDEDPFLSTNGKKLVFAEKKAISSFTPMNKKKLGDDFQSFLNDRSSAHLTSNAPVSETRNSPFIPRQSISQSSSFQRAFPEMSSSDERLSSDQYRMSGDFQKVINILPLEIKSQWSVKPIQGAETKPPDQLLNQLIVSLGPTQIGESPASQKDQDAHNLLPAENGPELSYAQSAPRSAEFGIEQAHLSRKLSSDDLSEPMSVTIPSYQRGRVDLASALRKSLTNITEVQSSNEEPSCLQLDSRGQAKSASGAGNGIKSCGQFNGEDRLDRTIEGSSTPPNDEDPSPGFKLSLKKMNTLKVEKNKQSIMGSGGEQAGLTSNDYRLINHGSAEIPLGAGHLTTMPELRFTRFEANNNTDGNSSMDSKESQVKDQMGSAGLGASKDSHSLDSSSSDLEDSYDSEAQQHFKIVDSSEPRFQQATVAVGRRIPFQTPSPNAGASFSMSVSPEQSKDSKSKPSESLKTDSCLDSYAEEDETPGVLPKKTEGFAPLMQRNDVSGQDEELDGIEEFYLTEIEQIQNMELISKLQGEEEVVRKKIIQQEALYQQLKATQDSNIFNQEIAKQAEKLQGLKNALSLINQKQKHFAFNIHKERQDQTSGSEGESCEAGPEQSAKKGSIKTQNAQDKKASSQGSSQSKESSGGSELSADPELKYLNNFIEEKIHESVSSQSLSQTDSFLVEEEKVLDKPGRRTLAEGNKIGFSSGLNVIEKSEIQLDDESKKMSMSMSMALENGTRTPNVRICEEVLLQFDTMSRKREELHEEEKINSQNNGMILTQPNSEMLRERCFLPRRILSQSLATEQQNSSSGQSNAQSLVNTQNNINVPPISQFNGGPTNSVSKRQRGNKQAKQNNNHVRMVSQDLEEHQNNQVQHSPDENPFGPTIENPLRNTVAEVQTIRETTDSSQRNALALLPPSGVITFGRITFVGSGSSDISQSPPLTKLSPQSRLAEKAEDVDDLRLPMKPQFSSSYQIGQKSAQIKTMPEQVQIPSMPIRQTQVLSPKDRSGQPLSKEVIKEMKRNLESLCSFLGESTNVIPKSRSKSPIAQSPAKEALAQQLEQQAVDRNFVSRNPENMFGAATTNLRSTIPTPQLQACSERTSKQKQFGIGKFIINEDPQQIPHQLNLHQYLNSRKIQSSGIENNNRMKFTPNDHLSILTQTRQVQHMSQGFAFQHKTVHQQPNVSTSQNSLKYKQKRKRSISKSSSPKKDKNNMHESGLISTQKQISAYKRNMTQTKNKLSRSRSKASQLHQNLMKYTDSREYSPKIESQMKNRQNYHSKSSTLQGPALMNWTPTSPVDLRSQGTSQPRHDIQTADIRVGSIKAFSPVSQNRPEQREQRKYLHAPAYSVQGSHVLKSPQSMSGQFYFPPNQDFSSVTQHQNHVRQDPHHFREPYSCKNYSTNQRFGSSQQVPPRRMVFDQHHNSLQQMQSHNFQHHMSQPYSAKNNQNVFFTTEKPEERVQGYHGSQFYR